MTVQVEGHQSHLQPSANPPPPEPSQTDSQNEYPVLSGFSWAPSGQTPTKTARNLTRSPPASCPGVRSSVPSQRSGEERSPGRKRPRRGNWAPGEHRDSAPRPVPHCPDLQARQPSVRRPGPPGPTPAAERGGRGTGAAPPPPAVLTVAQLLRSAPGRPLRNGASGRRPRCCSPRAATVLAAVTATVSVATAAAVVVVVRSLKRYCRLASAPRRGPARTSRRGPAPPRPAPARLPPAEKAQSASAPPRPGPRR